MKTPTPHPSADRLKLPWRIVKAANEYRIYTHAIGENKSGLMLVETHLRGEDDKEIAEYIVTCCNSHSALIAALEDLFAMMDEGLLVRDTSKDADSGWAIQQLRFVSRLKAAHSALALAPSTSKEGE